jgi:hypothetical protein
MTYRPKAALPSTLALSCNAVPPKLPILFSKASHYWFLKLLLCFLQEQAAAMFTMELGTAECRQQLFALDEQFPHYLNHGSYGATFRYSSC